MIFFRRVRAELEAATNALDEERFTFVNERIAFRDEQYKELRALHVAEMETLKERVRVLQESHDATAQWVRQLSGTLGVGAPSQTETEIDIQDDDVYDELADMTIEHIFGQIDGDPLGPVKVVEENA